MKELNVKLDVFEGPLDLLLHLIKKMEIDIYDIPISTITDQYIQYIQTMQEHSLEVAGEYIVMAANLMSIKSKMLLPQEVVAIDEGDVYESDPRDQLVQQLLDYKKFKQVAEIFQGMETNRGAYFTKQASDLTDYQQDVQPLKPNQVTTIDLFLAFHDVLQRNEIEEPLETKIIAEDYTIDEKMEHIEDRLKLLGPSQSLSFSAFFTHYSKSEIIVTFLAILELIKKKSIIAEQCSHGDMIQIYSIRGDL